MVSGQNLEQKVLKAGGLILGHLSHTSFSASYSPDFLTVTLVALAEVV